MAEYLVQDTSLTSVADAIRGKTGAAGLLSFPDGYIEEVNKLVDTSGDTVTAETLLSGYTAHGADGEPITGTVTGAPQKTVHTTSTIRFGQLSYSGNTLTFTANALYRATTDRLYRLTPGHTYTVTLGEYVNTIRFECYIFNFPGAEDIDLDIPDLGWVSGNTKSYTATGTIERVVGSKWITSENGYTFTATEEMNLMAIGFSGNSIGNWTNFHDSTYYRDIRSNFSITEEWDIEGTDEFRRSLVDDTLTYFEVPEGTTSLVRGAFYGRTQLIGIKIPDSVTTIGSAAFFGCTLLRLDKLPPNLTGNLADQAFFLCYRLRISEIPAGVTSIGSGAFGFCEDMPIVTFKGTPTSIHSNAFQNCTKITTINVPWAEGEVSGAPWGATNATINYNYTG